MRLSSRLSSLSARLAGSAGASAMPGQYELKPSYDVRPSSTAPAALIRSATVRLARWRALSTDCGDLQRLVGVVERAEHPVAVHVELATVAGDQLLEGPLIARLRRYQGGCRC
jgi:hypothetical protein